MLDCCPTDNSVANAGGVIGGFAGTTTSSSGTTPPSGVPTSFFTMDQTRQAAFVFNNSPLAALHNMTEMKVPVSGSCVLSPPYTSAANNTSANASKNPYLATPHSITDILGRPYNLAHMGALGMDPRLAPAAAAGMYFNNQVAAAARFAGKSASAPLGDLQGHLPLHWSSVGPSWRSGKIS